MAPKGQGRVGCAESGTQSSPESSAAEAAAAALGALRAAALAAEVFDMLAAARDESLGPESSRTMAGLPCRLAGRHKNSLFYLEVSWKGIRESDGAEADGGEEARDNGRMAGGGGDGSAAGGRWGSGQVRSGGGGGAQVGRRRRAGRREACSEVDASMSDLMRRQRRRIEASQAAVY